MARCQSQIFRGRHLDVIRSPGDQPRALAGPFDGLCLVGGQSPCLERGVQRAQQHPEPKHLRRGRAPQPITIEGAIDVDGVRAGFERALQGVGQRHG